MLAVVPQHRSPLCHFYQYLLSEVIIRYWVSQPAQDVSGTQAGSLRSWSPAAKPICLHFANSALDKASAISASLVEHLVIFSMASLQPIAAATVAIAVTSVEHKSHLELYPFFHIFTEPILSTQIRTG
jgi:hypothetical protein